VAAKIAESGWASGVCRECGGCCFSPTIPISDEDFEAFYARFAPGMTKEEFAAMFLQQGDENCPSRHIETHSFGGRCMFLSRSGQYGCDVWDKRPNVCRDFFCHGVTEFMKWQDGEDNPMYNRNATLNENLTALKRNIAENLDLRVFEREMLNYLRVTALNEAPSYYSAKMKPSDAGNGGHGA